MDGSVPVYLSPEEAMAVIRGIARLGEIIPTAHCRDVRMPERGFDLQDVIMILLNGKIRRPPRFKEEHRNYEYRVEGTTLDGDDAVAVTVILDHRSLMVLTVF